MFLIENKKMRFSDLDRYQQITYAKDFRIEFLESRGDAFQRLFEKLMGKCYPSDFMACRPWGNAGDWKNDGYLPSRRILFQVYAPNEICAAKAIEKINEDFAGAIEHWEEFFDEWVFVHNSHDSRLPPHVIMELAKLKRLILRSDSGIGVGKNFCSSSTSWTLPVWRHGLAWLRPWLIK
jgi:hypothetical protein